MKDMEDIEKLKNKLKLVNKKLKMADDCLIDKDKRIKKIEKRYEDICLAIFVGFAWFLGAVLIGIYLYMFDLVYRVVPEMLNKDYEYGLWKFVSYDSMILYIVLAFMFICIAYLFVKTYYVIIEWIGKNWK